MGAAFDVTGRGRTVVKAFAGRFYWNPSTTIVDDENPVGQAAARFVFDDLNGNGLLDRGPDDVSGTADDQTLHLLDRLPDVPEDRRYVNPGRHGLLPPDVDYHTVEVALNRWFSRRWMFLTSFLHTWVDATMRTTSSTSVRTAAVRLHRRHDVRVVGQPGAEPGAGLHDLLELQAGRPVRLPP